MKSEEHSKYRELMEEHPLLFARSRLPMTKTCMCWGIECGEGWHRPLTELCNQLETLNLTIGKQFGLVIRAEQVKEKYGTLHFYFGIETLCSLWRRVIAAPFDFLAWCFRTKFTPERINAESDEEGNFKKYDVVWHPRFRYWLCYKFGAIANWIKFSLGNDKRISVVHGALMSMVDKLIAEGEKECYNTCEDCGHQIGTDWSPRCETQGWINYICDECAIKRGGVYSIENLKTGKNEYFMGKKNITKEYTKKFEKDVVTPRTRKTRKPKTSKTKTAKTEKTDVE